MVAGDKACKWCEKGECWTHGQVKGPTFTKQGAKQNTGGMPFGLVMMDPSQMDAMSMMQAMMKGGWGMKGGGKGKGGAAAMMMGGKGGMGSMMMGGPAPGCKWCEKGECWTHQGVGGGKGKGKSGGPTKAMIEALACEPATEADLEVFLAQSPELEDGAIEKLKKLDPKLQRLIIEKGDMSDAKNKTAMLLSRIRRVNEMKEGEWVCPGCMELNWAKNTACHKCSTPNAA